MSRLSRIRGKEIKKRRLLIGLGSAVALLAIAAVAIWFLRPSCLGAGEREAPTPEKRQKTGNALYAAVSLESLETDAAIIVHGRVTGKSNTIDDTHISESGKESIRMHREVSVEVIDSIRNPEGLDVVTYNEPGGETEEVVFTMRDYPLTEVGDEIVLFLFEDGYCTPSMIFWVQEDGTVRVPDSMQPAAVQTQSEGQAAGIDTLDAADYVAVLTEYYAE